MHVDVGWYPTAGLAASVQIVVIGPSIHRLIASIDQERLKSVQLQADVVNAWCQVFGTQLLPPLDPAMACHAGMGIGKGKGKGYREWNSIGLPVGSLHLFLARVCLLKFSPNLSEFATDTGPSTSSCTSHSIIDVGIVGLFGLTMNELQVCL